MMNSLTRLWRDEAGEAAIAAALLSGLYAAAVITWMDAMSASLDGIFDGTGIGIGIGDG
ncbi:MAG: hypothetical protein ABFS30_10660 [Pseudomonadota bacterium]